MAERVLSTFEVLGFLPFSRLFFRFVKDLEPVWPTIFHHSISITYHSSLNFSHPFGIITQFPSLNIFHTICGPYMSVGVTFFFSLDRSSVLFFFFFKASVSLGIEKKKNKKKTQNWRPIKLKKKKSKGGQKLRLWVPPCVFIYENAIELWVIETENSLWLFSVSITHNSKIRELSDGNKVIVWPNNLFIMGPTIFELWVMETENWVIKFGWPNSLLFSKPICNFLTKDAYARVAYAT